jgi:hypothetical protein
VKKQKIFFLLYCLCFLIILSRCANPVSPTGGPKDLDPPEVVKCTPPNFSTFFNDDEIKIEFNEFVELESANNEITISPPWLPDSDFKLRGKSIVIKLNDTLHPNTTYVINFGKAISDMTENNVLENYIYVFSTGAYVDSLGLEGRIIDAFDLSPQKDVLAMLYLDDNDTIPFDSLPYKVKPYYLTRTNENGEFSLRNLSEKSFKLFALRDINSDLLYNLPDEKIAFSDSLVHGVYYVPPVPDTAMQDTTDWNVAGQDSVSYEDSLSMQIKNETFLTLRLFQQYDSVQRILKSKMIQDDQVGIYFRYPTKMLQFSPLNFTPHSDWKLEEINKTHDTIILWLRNVLVDSLILQVSDEGKIIDTLEIDLLKKKEKEKSAKKEGDKPKKLGITLNTQGGSLNQFKNDLYLVFSYPLTRFDLTSVSIVDEKDTLKPDLFITDSLKRAVKVQYKWKEDKKYRVIIPDSSFYGINELTNDSLIIAFRTKSAREFGWLKVSVEFGSDKGPYIIQLLNEKNAIVEQRILHGKQQMEFNYLNAQKYKLKAIYDQNRNKCWDTGVYLNKIQPEEVLFFPDIIEIRANWEVEEAWSF